MPKVNYLISTIFFLTALFNIESFKPIYKKNALYIQNNILNKQMMAKDDYKSMKIDESKLSQEEQDRLKFLQKLSQESDDIIRAAGLSVDDEEEDVEIVRRPIKDTQWTGQSDVEESIKSKKNFQDVINRSGLAVGDVGALLVFAGVGRSSHGEGFDLISMLSTAAPFIGSWLLISPFLGSFTRQATSSKGVVFKEIIPGWLVSMPVAIGIRGLLKGAVPPTPFIIVTMISTFVFLSIWRLIYIVLIGETSEDEYKSAGFFEVFKMIKSLVKRW
mmetsp:Transcript_26847/g.25706  ORF Transcript_26847/g.25706 Transcript_26847/m.25706 type:complete len:274 (+) Transcript_26847:199-1020(+)